MNLNFKPQTYQMIAQTSEWASIPRPRVIEGIVENHYGNIRSRKVVLTLNNDLWTKLIELSADTNASREDTLRHSIEELYLDFYPLVEEVPNPL